MSKSQKRRLIRFVAKLLAFTIIVAVIISQNKAIHTMEAKCKTLAFRVDALESELERIEAEPVELAEPAEPGETEALIALGKFELTAYCPCEECCGEWATLRPTDENGKPIVQGSTGIELKAGRSIAVDPSVIPYGTEVIINGHTYIAEDCGGAIKRNRVDIYFDDHQEALEFGVQRATVYVVEGGDSRGNDLC